MAFWTAIARYIAVEKLKTMGQDTLLHGRKVFSEELAQGKTQKEAARLAAKAMTEYASGQGRGVGQLAGRAGRLVRSKAGELAHGLRQRLRRK
ncbi:MAG: hypothetical protein AB7D47_08605 [Desulfovibrio sp.]